MSRSANPSEQDYPSVMQLPRISDPRGNLTFVEERTHLPFCISQVRWLYDIPSGAGKVPESDSTYPQLLISLSGLIKAHIFRGLDNDEYIELDSPDRGLILCDKRSEIVFDSFATGSVLLSIMGDVNDTGCDLDQAVCEAKCQELAESVHGRSSVDDASIISLPRRKVATSDHRTATLTFAVKGEGQVPFDIRRVYYLYDVPADSLRGGHSHIAHSELLIPVSGSVVVELSDGQRTRSFTLRKPWEGLLIPPGLWRVLHDFSAGTVLLVLTSHPYEEADYVREYSDFLTLTSVKTK